MEVFVPSGEEEEKEEEERAAEAKAEEAAAMAEGEIRVVVEKGTAGFKCDDALFVTMVEELGAADCEDVKVTHHAAALPRHATPRHAARCDAMRRDTPFARRPLRWSSRDLGYASTGSLERCLEVSKHQGVPRLPAASCMRDGPRVHRLCHAM